MQISCKLDAVLMSKFNIDSRITEKILKHLIFSFLNQSSADQRNYSHFKINRTRIKQIRNDIILIQNIYI
ncbi:hypothetical protein MTHERMMSTA1_00390 [Methanosarcina thermophila MST-A1]|nr:hypothetical protein MTHERMMSTA1_00390 [Methanosarcina thermophila MST-A1]